MQVSRYRVVAARMSTCGYPIIAWSTYSLPTSCLLPTGGGISCRVSLLFQCINELRKAKKIISSSDCIFWDATFAPLFYLTFLMAEKLRLTSFLRSPHIPLWHLINLSHCYSLFERLQKFPFLSHARIYEHSRAHKEEWEEACTRGLVGRGRVSLLVGGKSLVVLVYISEVYTCIDTYTYMMMIAFIITLGEIM